MTFLNSNGDSLVYQKSNVVMLTRLAGVGKSFLVDRYAAALVASYWLDSIFSIYFCLRS